MKFSRYLVLIYFIIEARSALSAESTNSKPKHILELSPEERREFLNSFDLVFSDIDGVVWNFYGKIEGTPDGYEALKKAGKNITFLTNNADAPTKKVLQKFKDIGMDVEEANILNPVKSTISYLKNINFDGLIYTISSENFKNALRDAGFQFIDGPNGLIEESIASLAENIFDEQPVRAVIFDEDYNFSLIKALRAQYYLRDPNCLFIVGLTNKFLLLRKDFRPMTTVAFLDALTEATNREPIILGKPGDGLDELIKQNFNIIDPKRVLMIGDTLAQDIGFGKKSGFQTLFVLTGDSKLEDIKEHVPDYYADSMADFGKFE